MYDAGDFLYSCKHCGEKFNTVQLKIHWKTDCDKGEFQGFNPCFSTDFLYEMVNMRQEVDTEQIPVCVTKKPKLADKLIKKS